jgi:hypothetical protein
MMDRFASWLATSPLSTAARVGIGAALTFIVENIGGFNFSPAVQVVVIAAVSTAIRWFNPADGVYGKDTTEVEQ